jgi:hypothetical protein
LVDLSSLSLNLVNSVYKQLETQSHLIGDICYTYVDCLLYEYNNPGSLTSPVERLRGELIHRRQYILIEHQLQHELLGSLAVIKTKIEQINELFSELKTLIGLRSSVPKDSVYPKFAKLANLFWELENEHKLNLIRANLAQLTYQHRDSFQPQLKPEDIQQIQLKIKQNPSLLRGYTESKSKEPIHFDNFVETVVENNNNNNNDSNSGSNTISTRPVRLTRESCSSFMSLPLEDQGYCSVSLLKQHGLLTAGNPSLGIIRVLGRYYSFVNIESMKAFCLDPEFYIEGIIKQSKKIPGLIHLLGLQAYIPYSDISQFFTVENLNLDLNSSDYLNNPLNSRLKTTANASSQTPSHYINTDELDPDYHWNEWELRRQAIKLANLTNCKTSSSQTVESHNKRDNSSQYNKPKIMEDGTAEGIGTQTRLEKGTNVERNSNYIVGLRGNRSKENPIKLVNLSLEPIVTHPTNPDLRKTKFKQ